MKRETNKAMENINNLIDNETIDSALSLLTCLPDAIHGGKATIARWHLSPRFFCIDAKLLCEFESDKILINQFE